jgi:amidase
MAGPDNGDPGAAPVPLRQVDLATLRQTTRIGYFEDDGRMPVTPETRDAVQRAARTLEDAGFAVDRFLPEGLEEARRLWHFLFVDSVAMLLRQAYSGREDAMYSIVREMLAYSQQDSAVTAQSLLETLFGRDTLRAAFLDQMEKYPILLCPVSAAPAFKHGERSWTIEGKTVNYPETFSYSQWFNLLGNPAAVVPISKSPEGLPIGVQIVGRPWDEELVLAVAACVEEAGGYREPPID